MTRTTDAMEGPGGLLPELVDVLWAMKKEGVEAVTVTDESEKSLSGTCKVRGCWCAFEIWIGNDSKYYWLISDDDERTENGDATGSDADVLKQFKASHPCPA